MRILEALGELGWVTPGALSKAIDIDRSSVYRLLDTLVELGYVSRRKEDGTVALTPRLAQISDGIRKDDIHAQIAAPFLRRLTEHILWPSDFASFDCGSIKIRFSTHRQSPMTIYRGVIGETRLLVRSALGKAILSAMTEQELEAARDFVSKLAGQDADDVRDTELVRHVIQKTRADGYAISQGESLDKISAIALPVRGPDRKVIGAVNVIYFTSALTSAEAVRRYLEPMSTCVNALEAALDAEQFI